MYPIAIKASYLDTNGFFQPDGTYSDEIYQNKTQKRLFMLLNTNPTGGYSFLRWRTDSLSGTSMAVTAAITGTGNLGAGFEEAPWPSNSWLPPMDMYPYAPGRFNPADWTYISGVTSIGSDLAAALQYHVDRRTLMTLPIYDESVAAGTSNGRYYIRQPGTFLLRGFGFQSSPSADGQGWYLDLVYIDEPPLVYCEG